MKQVLFTEEEIKSIITQAECNARAQMEDNLWDKLAVPRLRIILGNEPELVELFRGVCFAAFETGALASSWETVQLMLIHITKRMTEVRNEEKHKGKAKAD